MLVVTYSSPWNTFCQRLPKHSPISQLALLAKGCWRKQRDFTKPSKKTWEWNSVTSSVGNSMPETSLNSCEGLEMGMRARQGRKLPREGEQNPVSSSHHCALFNLHNCVSRAQRISLHFEFPAFCRLASQELFETLPLLWSLQKRNPCSISMCPGCSVGSQCQGSHFK